jgi:hypothetical protein
VSVCLVCSLDTMLSCWSVGMGLRTFALEHPCVYIRKWNEMMFCCGSPLTPRFCVLIFEVCVAVLRLFCWVIMLM